MKKPKEPLPRYPTYLPMLRCDNQECHYRRYEAVERNPLDGSEEPDPAAMQCPACKGPVVIESRRTPQEYRKAQALVSLNIVNHMLYAREEYGNASLFTQLGNLDKVLPDLTELPEEWTCMRSGIGVEGKHVGGQPVHEHVYRRCTGPEDADEEEMREQLTEEELEALRERDMEPD